LGAERFLDPETMAVLSQLCQGLIDQYGTESLAATMLIDLAVVTYFHALRVQGWVGDLKLWIEHEFFAEESLRVKLRRQYGAGVEGFAVEEHLRRLKEQLLPVFERVNRQLLQNLQALQGTRPGKLPLLAIGLPALALWSPLTGDEARRVMSPCSLTATNLHSTDLSGLTRSA
jgi:hypothetical protein